MLLFALAGRPAPAKPWERAGGSSTSHSPADGLPKPWERPAGAGPVGRPGSAASAHTARGPGHLLRPRVIHSSHLLSAGAGTAGPTVTPASATTSALAAVTGGISGAATPAPRPWERTAAGAPSTSYGTGYGGAPAYGSGSMYSRCAVMTMGSCNRRPNAEAGLGGKGDAWCWAAVVGQPEQLTARA